MNSTEQNNEHIRLFVSAHKQAVFPDGASIIPIQVGAANTENLFPDTLHDNEGENISDKNPMYCELTAQYWAWKNAKADYYGFCHYRRYFDFSGIHHEQNDYGEIIDDFIDKRTIEKYGLNDDSIAASVKGWDVITSPINDVRLIGGFSNLKEHWAADKHLRIEDLEHMMEILCRRHPDYRQDASHVLNGHKAAFCNMFIMRKDIFFAYNEWLFPLLDEFTSTSDFSRADTQTLRTVGHLSERLLNIFLAHQQRIGKHWKIKTLQCVHFTHPELYKTELEPLDRNPRLTVPVVFAADNNYVPMLTTTIYSMLKNADPERYYDIIVLQRDISKENRQSMADFFRAFPHAHLRFFNVSQIISGYELTTHNEHISIETYYRFIIQQILPFYSKIIYLDSDLVVNGDITELYDTDLGDAAIGAVHDLDFLGNLNMKNGERAQYVQRKLHMHDPYGYFQAGVLVMNLERMREIHTVKEWLGIASDPDFIYNDQDILNVACERQVKYLDYSWNVMHNCADRVNGVFAFAPAQAYQDYLRSRRDPKIVHYAGFDKPWKNPWCDFGPLYWQYAAQTPFEIQMVAMLSGLKPPKPLEHHERAIAEDSPLRKYADALAPIGSKRREVLKVTTRKLRHRE
ncbi:DUF4422 domain-containing protein [Bifidobacterium sp. ESL0800]|uniref:DUF4422 domain-containing protein n=1 Tax=Bifidobacterium sp. ESL0800 TaxID=2983236 RepID=UPI0023F62EDF|nr:DUF4422 domain-containing protein [Bifidobacterium sp. ESL0800]WEV75225.1 DUF4422 domain-containing protein [Bifidobacterium sp. ESL0800]